MQNKSLWSKINTEQMKSKPSEQWPPLHAELQQTYKDQEKQRRVPALSAILAIKCLKLDTYKVCIETTVQKHGASSVRT